MLIPLYDENPTQRFPLVTVTLIALNALVFLYEISLSPQQLNLLFFQWAVVPGQFVPAIETFDLSNPALFTVFSAMFMHAGWLHVGGNMLYLWVFGNNIEDRLGRGQFLLFYLAAGIIGTLAHAYADPTSFIPSLGASGAIAGVLGAYLILYPTARVVTAVPIFVVMLVRVPALVVLGLWIFIQLISGFATVAAGPTAAGNGGVAWFAHIGGFAAGLVLILLLPKQPPPSAGSRFRRWSG